MVGIGEYLVDPAVNMAEVAYSVSVNGRAKAWPGKFSRNSPKGRGEKGVAGLLAYTSPDNKAMIGLFHHLPYRIKTHLEDEMLTLTCRFDEPA